MLQNIPQTIDHPDRNQDIELGYRGLQIQSANPDNGLKEELRLVKVRRTERTVVFVLISRLTEPKIDAHKHNADIFYLLSLADHPFPPSPAAPPRESTARASGAPVARRTPI